MGLEEFNLLEKTGITMKKLLAILIFTTCSYGIVNAQFIATAGISSVYGKVNIISVAYEKNITENYSYFLHE